MCFYRLPVSTRYFSVETSHITLPTTTTTTSASITTANICTKNAFYTHPRVTSDRYHQPDQSEEFNHVSSQHV
jgi:hypothetical protein